MTREGRRYSRYPIRAVPECGINQPRSTNIHDVCTALHRFYFFSVNCAAFYTKVKGGPTDLSFHICKSIHWRLCDDFNTSASNFHTYPKSGFWRIPRTPWFLAIDGVIPLGKLRRVSPRPTNSPDTMPTGGFSAHGLAYLEHQSIFCRHSRRLPQLLCFFYSVHQSEREWKKRKTKSSKFVKRQFKNHYASSKFSRQMEVRFLHVDGEVRFLRTAGPAVLRENVYKHTKGTIPGLTS